MAVARIVINLSLDREFDYEIPAELASRVHVGSRVRIPFGRGNSYRTGYVVGIHRESSYPDLKTITALEDEHARIPENLVRLAHWIAEYYCCAREQAVRAMLPAVVRGGRMRRRLLKFAGIAAPEGLPEQLATLERRAPSQAAVLRTLVRLGPTNVILLRRETGVTSGVIKRLEEAGLIRIEERAVDRDPFADDVVLPSTPLKLTSHQQAALAQVTASLEAKDGRTILLHGVTGSGKTEVYLQAIQRCLELGRQAIVLVPEISLTPQTTERFRSRFGDQVSVLHSGLSDGERFDEWTKANEGRTSIVVGARSALFAPFRRLALIVVDEEHETTYKQDEAPRYHARDVAVVRGRAEGATVLLGSATPSLESYHNCRLGKYTLCGLPERIDGRTMPLVELVDMRAEAALRGGPKIFSRRLEDMIRGRLDAGDQTILFLNRRGYATQMLCTECGYVATCPDCSIAYTYHRADQRLCCHLCGRVLAAPQRCPQCNDPEIRYSGLGTEKVESVAKQLFPQATIGRMDSDTMTARHAHRDMLAAFRSGRIHILIGTQMIAKGLHFPNVTLVGVIFADLALYLPDFRAAERTFQLLTQVAGRAGRGDTPGRVVVQTYTPHHPALQCSLQHDFTAFFEQEMPTRIEVYYPPATHMIVIHFRGPSEQRTAEAAETFAHRLGPQLDPAVQISGPLPAPIAKIRRCFRYQLALRGGNTRQLVRMLRQFVMQEQSAHPEVQVFADVDPQSLL